MVIFVLLRAFHKSRNIGEFSVLFTERSLCISCFVFKLLLRYGELLLFIIVPVNCLTGVYIFDCDDSCCCLKHSR